MNYILIFFFFFHLLRYLLYNTYNIYIYIYVIWFTYMFQLVLIGKSVYLPNLLNQLRYNKQHSLIDIYTLYKIEKEFAIQEIIIGTFLNR